MDYDLRGGSFGRTRQVDGRVLCDVHRDALAENQSAGVRFGPVAPKDPNIRRQSEARCVTTVAMGKGGIVDDEHGWN